MNDATTETFDALRGRLRARYDGLSPHLQRIARYALEDPNSFALQTVTALAERAQVQPSTLVRFAKEFGFAGFSDLQKVFKLRLIEGGPDYRERAYQHRKKLEASPDGDPFAVLTEFTAASMLSLERLKATVDPQDLRQALKLLQGAQHVAVIGQRRAFPIAAYLAYGLVRLEYRCQLFDFVGGMVPQQAAALRPTDLLVAISFAEYTPAVVDVVREVAIRDVPIIAITDLSTSPLAKHGRPTFFVDDLDVHQFKPIAGAIGLVQSLIIALGATR